MSDYQGSFIPSLGASVAGVGPYQDRDLDLRQDVEASHVESFGSIAVIEGRTFLRECIRRSIQSAFPAPVLTYSTVADFERELPRRGRLPELVLFSLADPTAEGCADALERLSVLIPGATFVVLGQADDLDLARAAIHGGARGYIPSTMGFEIAVEAIRFILAGGTYVPTECLLATGQVKSEGSRAASPNAGITRRELAVVRAIQQGKSNKIIAYELNLCESTVKVHVRNVMKKMGAKNRTEVAIKAQRLLSGASASALGETADRSI